MEKAQLKQEQLSRAHLVLTDQADGSLVIEARHAGDFDPAMQSHACLRAVTQFLPQVLGAAGTRVDDDGASGTRMAISDGERYQALRALALLEEEQAVAIARAIESGSAVRTEADYDAQVDRLVAIVRGLPQ